ncbi:hypothetical protein Tco_1178330, partial [Tanacetum coccineum]
PFLGANGLTSTIVNGYLVKAHQTHSCSCGDPVAVYLSMPSFLLLLQCSEVCFWRWFQDVAVQSSGAFNERSI